MTPKFSLAPNKFDPKLAGWIPHEDRTVEMVRQFERWKQNTPTVSESIKPTTYRGDRPRQWELMKLAIEKKIVPQEWVRNGTLKNLNQLTGSCVGFGAANCLLWASVVDALILNQPEKIMMPFFGYHYGLGRMEAGIRGRGEGSTGSGQAQALEKYGWLTWEELDVPKPSISEVAKWSSSVEMEWSDGARIAEKYKEVGSKRSQQSVRATTLEECQTLLDKYYTFTVASDWGGSMQCSVKDGVLLNRYSTTWWHQMWVLDYIIHPRLGRLWWIGNNWGYPHGKDPGGEWDNGCGAPEGGFYVDDSGMSRMLRGQEVFAFLDLKGEEDRDRAISWRMG